ncbi:hypothetical protein F2Q69_00042776 [Brassica cretica]|uniref:Uncharacterized protein n=1 Tax=Brassica cretica TaxID=69181 RepID=A0A8S9NEV4_BRACR|nr:hypothetical protein F2Q69_00042776 [Brassica cretica]
MWPREHGALVGTWPNGHVALGAWGSRGTWPEQMVDLSICCSEHDVSRCFSEHGGTLLMSWISWPEPPIIGMSKKKVFQVRNLASAAVELVSSDYGRLGPSSLGRINHSAWKPEAGPRPGGRDPGPDPGVGTQNLGVGTRNLGAGTQTRG